MIAHFDAEGRVIAIGDEALGPVPGAEFTAEVATGTNPNSIYFKDGEVLERATFPIIISAGEITGIPVGTVARVAGFPAETVTDGSLQLTGEVNHWVSLSHPHYRDWAGNVTGVPQD